MDVIIPEDVNEEKETFTYYHHSLNTFWPWTQVHQGVVGGKSCQQYNTKAKSSWRGSELNLNCKLINGIRRLDELKWNSRIKIEKIKSPWIGDILWLGIWGKWSRLKSLKWNRKIEEKRFSNLREIYISGPSGISLNKLQFPPADDHKLRSEFPISSRCYPSCSEQD